MASDVNKFHFRLVLLGSNETGKTAILNRFLFKKFEQKYKPTVEDLFSKEFDLGSIELKVDFLDTSGSMQFPAMRRLSITTGDAFLVVYALDDENSYEVVKLCMAEIQEVRPDFQEIPIVFAGNKSDLPRERRRVPKELVSNYVYYELPRLRTKVIECSCRDNVNVDSIFKSYLSLARVTVNADALLQGAASQPGPQHPHHSSLTTKKRPASALPAGPAEEAPNGGGGQSRAPSRCGSLKEAPSAKNSGGGGGTEFQGRDRNSNSAASSSCATSIKAALGVRKSCDGSMVSSMRKLSLSTGASSRNSRDQLLECANEPEQPQRQQPAAAVHQIERHQPAAKQQMLVEGAPTRRLNQKSSIESLLKEASSKQQHQHQLSSKLTVEGQGAKPRSRSLIWRSHRKSRATQSEASECRVT